MTFSECCLIKLLSDILLEKYIYILASEMASPSNQHCANCIGTLSFPITDRVGVMVCVRCRAYSKRVFAVIVHSELKSVHPGFPVAFIF